MCLHQCLHARELTLTCVHKRLHIKYIPLCLGVYALRAGMCMDPQNIFMFMRACTKITQATGFDQNVKSLYSEYPIPLQPTHQYFRSYFTAYICAIYYETCIKLHSFWGLLERRNVVWLQFGFILRAKFWHHGWKLATVTTQRNGPGSRPYSACGRKLRFWGLRLFKRQCAPVV